MSVSPRDPVESFEVMCQKAEMLDLLCTAGSITDSAEAKEIYQDIERGVSALDKLATVRGHQTTPIFDDDGFLDGSVFSDTPSIVTGVYKGLDTVSVFDEFTDFTVEEPKPTLRIAHVVQTGETLTFTEKSQGLHTQLTPIAYVALHGADVQIHSPFDNHSLEYLEQNEMAAAVVDTIDALFADEDLGQAEKIKKISEVLIGACRYFNDDEKLRDNVLSYVNSLGLFRGLACMSEYLVNFTNGPEGTIIIPGKGTMVCDEIEGLNITDRIRLNGRRVTQTTKNCVYLHLRHETYGPVTVPLMDAVLI